MTKGAVESLVEDVNSHSPGSATQKALRKYYSKTMASSIISCCVSIMPWQLETIRTNMYSAVSEKLSGHICSISSCHCLETQYGMGHQVIRVRHGGSTGPSANIQISCKQSSPIACKIHDSRSKRIIANLKCRDLPPMCSKRASNEELAVRRKCIF